MDIDAEAPDEVFSPGEWTAFARMAYERARGLGLAHHDAWDVASVVMVELLIFSRIDEPERPNAWIRTATRFRAIDLMQLRDRSPAPASPTAIADTIASPEEGSEERVLDVVEAVGIVHYIFEYVDEVRLTERQREAIRDFFWYRGTEESVAGICRELAERCADGPSGGTVRTHFKRASQKIVEYLAEQGIELEGGSS
jgi:hypothetical protein